MFLERQDVCLEHIYIELGLLLGIKEFIILRSQ